jgi:hypothetical protein
MLGFVVEIYEKSQDVDCRAWLSAIGSTPCVVSDRDHAQVFFIAAEARRAAVDYMAAHSEVKNFVVVPQ